MVTWNVRGSMRGMDSDGRIVKLLGRHHFLCLTNTGTDTAHDTVLQDFTCIKALPRPVHVGATTHMQALATQLSGGVALFAHNSIASRVTVVRTRAAMGILWVRVEPTQPEHKAVYIATCYIPHMKSAYYSKPGAPSLDSVWDALQQDVLEFKSTGSVMLAGDFNARVGIAADHEEHTEWEGTEEHTGVAPPLEDLRMQRVLQNLPRRDSQDSECNEMGQRLLDMCKATGLLILNGRLPGDEQGACTFYGPLGKQKSGSAVLDYCIATSDLAFGATGRVARGCTMRITKSTQRLPPRPGRNGRTEGRFDHVPVAVQFRLQPMQSSMTAGRQREGPSGDTSGQQPGETAGDGLGGQQGGMAGNMSEQLSNQQGQSSLAHTAGGSHVLLRARAGQASSPGHPAITCARDSVLRASGGPADGASPPPPGQAHDGQDTHERASKWQWPQRATCDEYVGIMQSDGVQAHLGAVNSDMQGREALQKVIDSITAAADQLHALHGGVVQRAGGQRTQQAHRPTNRWYNRDCAQARHALRRAERLQGAGSEGARAARAAYRQTVKQAKQSFEDQKMQSMLADIYRNPRAFWQKYNKEATQEQAAIALDEWRLYFHGLLLAVGDSTYVQGDLNAHCAHFASLYPQPSAEAQAAAAHLNQPFTTSEVQASLRKLQNNKAAGCDGLVAEFLTKAVVQTREEGVSHKEYILAPALTVAFNAVLQGGYPTDFWGVSALIPVPKPKGQPGVKDDYRGIAVGSVLAKLYALMVLARLDAWAESTGKRATGQAGFRPGRGTPDNCFILRHVIDAAAVRKKPLYCAFVDFSKAYDRVDRALLWRVLEGMGLHGQALTTLQQMYEGVQLRVRLGGDLSEPFPSTVGVRQGCPLSPLLFGLVIDRLEQFLAERCPNSGTMVAGQLLRALLYADDAVLICDSAQQLQALLDALSEFCTANCMRVNETKTHVVVFNSAFATGAPTFMYQGRQLHIKPSYVYLGLKFVDGEACKHTLASAVAKARKVMHAMFARCYRWGLHNLNAQGHLFDTLVKPVLSFGCEVWGPDWVAPMCTKGSFCTGLAETQVHFPFMRQSMGVRKSTSTAVMMEELHRDPLAFHWLRMAVQLWNKALSRPAGDYLRLAVEDNVQLSGQAAGAAASQLWAHHFTRALDALGCQWKGSAGLMRVNPADVQQAMRDKWVDWEWRAVNAGTVDAAWCEGTACTVRAAPESFSKGFKMFVYKQWFAQPQGEKGDSYVMHLTGREQIAAVAQLRTGSHWLMVDKGRRLKVDGKWSKVPRGERCCAHCQGCVEDEMHLLECPRWALQRESHGLGTYAQGGAGDVDMRETFNPTDRHSWHQLGKFLVHCKYETMLS